MERDVIVGRRDLRKLVQLLNAVMIERQAQRLLRVRQPKGKTRHVKEYLAAVKSLVPEAREHEAERFAELLASLKSGENVRQSLAMFVTREAKSPAETDTKAPLLQ